MELQEKLTGLLEHLEEGLIERETPVRLALLAALSGEHLLMIGPPGTAKSEIARRLHQVFEETDYFERLLTRFSVPEELFGPLSLEALEEDRYERKIDGYLPTATVGFVDEIFKANSAILNSLLTLINEREFDNGTDRIVVPLMCLVGASNELPEGTELDALYDRFLLRCHVGPVSADGFREVLCGEDLSMPEIPEELRLSPTEVQLVQEQSAKVEMPEGVADMLAELRERLHDEDIYVSDRRWRKVGKLLKTAAYTNGRDEVSVFDGWLMQHCLWNEPEEREVVWEWYRERVGADSVSAPGNFTRIVEALEATLERDRESKTHERDDDGNLLYHAEDGGTTTDTSAYQKTNSKGQPFYLAPEGTEARETGGEFTRAELNDEFAETDYRGYNPKIREGGKSFSLEEYTAKEKNFVMVEPAPSLVATPFSSGHVAERVERTGRALADVEDHILGLADQLELIEEHISSDHWLPTEFAEVASRKLKQRTDDSEVLADRLSEVKESFEGLPTEETIDA